MIDNPKKADHEDLVVKIKKYSKSLPNELGVNCIREFYRDVIEEMEKMTDKIKCYNESMRRLMRGEKKQYMLF